MKQIDERTVQLKSLIDFRSFSHAYESDALLQHKRDIATDWMKDRAQEAVNRVFSRG